ncbi:MAG TPA: DUF2142 domain-containing protein, partial [Solirubrobacteraceae bacterium]|nr:DUF2142 domain-containing protein [Solirubrobacteraceae bacterium]
MSGGLARVPRMAVICAAVACLNAMSWLLITPAFEVPDEPDHFAYVKQLAETGQLPSSSSEELSQEELDVLVALHYERVRLRPQVPAISTQGEQVALERTIASGPRERGSPAAGVAASEPPLYYALEAVPYTLAQSGSVLDRLLAMRVLSALFAGLSALFVYLFVREALPAAPWAWSVAGLAVALAPLLAFMSGAVNPDALLSAVSAALFYCLARAFRRGLSARGAVAIGLVTALGFASKLSFVGLAPGVLLGLVLLAVRQARAHGPAAYRLLAIAGAIALSPAALVSFHDGSVLELVSQASGSAHLGLAEISCVWQLYLPALPGTVSDFPGLLTARQIWFDQYVGLYGWLDTPLPGWVDSLALAPALAIALLCGRSLFRRRRALRARAGELLTYAVMSVGLMALIGAASYNRFPATDAEFGQVRYLLPLLAL